MPEAYLWLCAVFEEMGKKHYDETVNIAITYMMRKAEDAEALQRVCTKNERGLWCKR